MNFVRNGYKILLMVPKYVMDDLDLTDFAFYICRASLYPLKGLSVNIIFYKLDEKFLIK